MPGIYRAECDLPDIYSRHRDVSRIYRTRHDNSTIIYRARHYR